MAQFVFYQWIAEFLFKQDFGFVWDKGNNEKNSQKHGVTSFESEEVFFDEMLIVLGLQISPQVSEDRFGVIGRTKLNRLLFISFTIRKGQIRVISVRSANRKERGIYEK